MFSAKRLAARQHGQRIVMVVDVRQLAFVVEAGDDADAAALRARGCQRHPGGDMLERRQPEIGRILMPGDVVLAVRRLQPRRGVKHQNVRPDHILNQVEDPGMAHQLGGPREQR